MHARRGERRVVCVYGANARNRRIDFPSRIWGRTTVLRANGEPKDSSWEGVWKAKRSSRERIFRAR